MLQLLGLDHNLFVDGIDSYDLDQIVKVFEAIYRVEFMQRRFA